MTRKQFFTNPVTIVVGSVIVITAVVLIYGYYNLGWFGGGGSMQKQINCKSNADCPDAGTHCGDEGLCVYDLSSQKQAGCSKCCEGNNPCEDCVHCAQETIFVTPVNPRPTPTPNPDGGVPPRPAGVR